MVPGGSQLSGLLPVIEVADRVTVPPELKMPPPRVAVLPVTWLWFKVTGPPTMGIGPGRGTPLAMPPPTPPARLLFTMVLLRVKMADPAAPGGPWALIMPPPEASRPVPAAVLPFTSDLLSVIVPWFTIPAPPVKLVVLLSTWLLFSTASPPLAMPPAAIGGPSPGAAVAVLPLTWDLLSTRWLVPGGMPPLPFPLEMPPPFSEVLPFTWLLLRVAVPSRFWMPPPPAFGAVLPFTWLLLRVSTLLVPEKPK